MYKNLPTTLYIPESPKLAIEKCIESRKEIGYDTLLSCHNGIFNGDKDRPYWMCSFTNLDQSCFTIIKQIK
ncbi:MAG: hypothetical protein A2152_04205 [Candidatus Levybacteria bacterium RBG_16_35_6]|uniref:Uncharacterized protein n=1 Tax=Candidatus Woesebacteria bacterium RBG_13_36_22 TaxID=1802478 RepID=A0A1F7X2I0_9BACT|nr:MAG: hypothetical protein A2152_04205 [Candidatus Levybacteria bacterium RBG_16_35_6]OGM08515.1 MAG: hypothetical protein A2Z67_02175 [Candidatus Woesebacteria bacterium RBG_13_36_22]